MMVGRVHEICETTVGNVGVRVKVVMADVVTLCKQAHGRLFVALGRREG